MRDPVRAPWFGFFGPCCRALHSDSHVLAPLQGVLMQIFTRPLSDRPTVFVEIIQRIGCEREVPGTHSSPASAGSACSTAPGSNLTAAVVQAPSPSMTIKPGVLLSWGQHACAVQRMTDGDESAGINGGPPRKEQAGGCGGFGKGNFSELFKSIEDYEKTLKI